MIKKLRIEKYFDIVQKLKMVSINVTNFSGTAGHIFIYALDQVSNVIQLFSFTYVFLKVGQLVEFCIDCNKSLHQWPQ